MEPNRKRPLEPSSSSNDHEDEPSSDEQDMDESVSSRKRPAISNEMEKEPMVTIPASEHAALLADSRLLHETLQRTALSMRPYILQLAHAASATSAEKPRTSMLPPELLQTIVSYLRPHLRARLLSRSWDAAVQTIHSRHQCKKCYVQCKFHNVAERRERVPWHLQWVIRGAFDLATCVRNPRLFQGIKFLEVALEGNSFHGLSTLLFVMGNEPTIESLELKQMPLTEKDVLLILSSPSISKLTYLGVWKASLSEAGLRAIASCPHLSNLKRLDFSLSRSVVAADKGASAAHILSSSSALSSLEKLIIYSSAFGEAAIKSLCNSPHLTNLVDLTIPLKNPVRTIFALNSPYGSRMKKLKIPERPHEMRNSEVYLQFWKTLGQTYHRNDHFSCIQQMDLSHIPSDTLDVFLSTPHLTSVTKLTISGTYSTPFANLSSTPFLCNLKELNISSVDINQDDVEDFCGAEVFYLTSLRSLKMTDIEDLDSTAYILLVSCAHLSRLNSLLLNGCALEDEVVVALCSSTHFGCLQSLDLSSNNLTEESAQALGTCLTLPSLQYLNLQLNTDIGTIGAHYLRQVSSYLTSLTDLNIGSCGLESASVVALTKKCNLSTLRRLDLAGSRLTKDDFDILSRCTSLASLESLDLADSLSEDLSGLDMNHPIVPTTLFVDSCLTNLTKLSLVGDTIKNISYPVALHLIRNSPIMNSMSHMDLGLHPFVANRHPWTSDEIAEISAILSTRLEKLRIL